jgi:hypothetical protein
MKVYPLNNKKQMTHHYKGVILLFTLVIMTIISSVVGSYLGFVQSSIKSIGAQISDSQAIYLADAGLEMSIWYLRNIAPDGSTDCSWRTAAYPANPGPGATDPQQISLGEGTFTIWVQDSGSDVQVYSRGTAGGLSRVITRTLALGSEVLERAIHADGAHLKLTDTSGTINGNVSCFISILPDPLPTGLTITGNIVQGNDQVKVSPDFVLDSYYTLANDAGQVATEKTFSNGTYTGIWYITNDATIGDNARIEGSVISEKTITFGDKANNVFIDPTLYDSAQNYPALYAGTSIISTGTGKPSQRIGLQNSTINGLVLAGNNITFDYISNSTFNGTILAGNNMQMENGTNLTVNYDKGIFSPMPIGFTFSGGENTVLSQTDWNEL